VVNHGKGVCGVTYSFSFLQALLLREPELRARLFRPLKETVK
jgi:hypothetical protein